MIVMVIPYLSSLVSTDCVVALASRKVRHVQELTIAPSGDLGPFSPPR